MLLRVSGRIIAYIACLLPLSRVALGVYSTRVPASNGLISGFLSESANYFIRGWKETEIRGNVDSKYESESVLREVWLSGDLAVDVVSHHLLTCAMHGSPLMSLENELLGHGRFLLICHIL
ncbi:hypothetical protein J6590_030675 [Homalodisca vitripennis]|nr:hypothetical protein J6590_030675 [Homalodisca vitripennis]